MKKYTLAVTSPEYWSEIHDALIVDSNQDGIPDRQVTCTDNKNHSPTRGTYELTEDEAAEIGAHPHVKWIELSPTDNPEAYPDPSPATKRFRGNVKIYRDLGTNAPPATNPTAADDRRTNWAVKRVGVATNGDKWPNVTGNPAVINDDVSYNLTGKNVDIVIHDSGVLQYHPEFMINGQSRVNDIVLDGPYHIDPDYFTTNNFTYTKPDGRTGITTASAEGWWENASNRSAAFQSEGTVAIPATYTASRAVGDNLDGTNGMSSGHGTCCAGLAAGKYMGLAFEANIWNMPGIGDAVGMGIEANYDLMKIWHRNKPINTETGRRNPTVINGSWGYQAAFESTDSVNYKFRGSTGSFTGNAGTTDQVTAMKNGLNNQVTGAYKSWSSSSRSNSTNTAADEMMAEGVIYVAAAGNNNQRLGIGSNDPDRLNYMDDDWFNTTDPRAEFPTGTVPCNHRDWMNPQGIGFDSATDFHPVICVGAMDEFINADYSERKASYSNNGPGIDVWAPADETLAPGTNGVTGYTDYQRYDDNRFYDNNFNGTSAAAPVAAGLIALYMEMNPTATSRQVKDWLKRRGSKLTDAYQDEYTDDTQTTYWTGSYNMRGAEKRILHDETANDGETFVGLGFDAPNVTTTGLVMHIDGPTGFDTDLSGNNNVPTWYSDNPYNGVSYFNFQGTANNSGGGGISGISITGGSFAIEAWIQLLGNANAGGYGQIVCQDDGSSNGQGWQWRIGDTNYQQDFVYWTTSARGSAVDLSSAPTSIPLNDWSHVAVTYDGTDIRMFLNGVQDFIHTPASSLYGSSANIGIGRFGGGGFATGYRLNARYGAIRLYNQFLTGDQIKSHYDLHKERFVDNKFLSFEGISFELS